MRILWVEDDLHDIKGLLLQCRARNWTVDTQGSFLEGIMALEYEDPTYNLVVVDMMLPWGTGIPDVIRENYSETRAGLAFVEAIRGYGQGQSILGVIGLASVHDKYDQVPVFVLSRVDGVRDECIALDVKYFFSKADYDWRDFIAAAESLSH